MREHLDSTRHRWITWGVAVVALSMLTWMVACGEDTPSASSPLSSADTDAEGDFVSGVQNTASLTTLPPPPSPGAPPPRAPADPKNRRHGILLAQDQPCPGCTLVTPSGRAQVAVDTPLSAIMDGGEVSISFDQLNDMLHVGIPLKIRVDDGMAESPFAIWLLVDRPFATTGQADRSSGELQSTGELILSTFTEASGPVTITYVLGEGEEVVVERFEAGERIFISGVAVDGRLILRVARPDV